MQFSHSMIQALNGEIQIVSIHLGRPFFYHFCQFKKRRIWENILDFIVVNERKRQGKQETPSLLAIDSQSIKKVQFTNEETGIDGGKTVNGRK